MSTVFRPETFRMASGLIDNVAGGYSLEHELIGDEWYLAKPEMYLPLRRKLMWCKEILQEKAIAVHYKRDEL